TNPTTASSVTFMSKPASRAFARHASTWEFSATAAAIASASSFANRFTTSSIPASSSHRRRARIRGVSRSEPALAGEAWQRSGAKDVHLYGFSPHAKAIGIVESVLQSVNPTTRGGGRIAKHHMTSGPNSRFFRTPADITELNADADLGSPGAFPFTRGIQSSM